jgi:hypothetical protein
MNLNVYLLIFFMNVLLLQRNFRNHIANVIILNFYEQTLVLV